jgi:hypothetical protein
MHGSSLFFIYFIAEKINLSVSSMMATGYRDLFFWDLFLHRNYLFIWNLLTVSRFSRTRTIALISLTLAIALIHENVWDFSINPGSC